MKFLNLGCGATRPQGPEWTNVDNLMPVLAVGTPERNQLDSEKNYVNADITNPLPFRPDTFDGCVCSHVIEHFDCQMGVFIMRQIRDVLKAGGILLVSVPDASYFRQQWPDDQPENAERLFGEPIHLPDGEQTFFGYALWNRYHKAILTEDALWCYFIRAGFDIPAQVDAAVLGPLTSLLNRRKFSVEMMGVKP
jgi:predicted SAM-dependent methyltransferase